MVGLVFRVKAWFSLSIQGRVMGVNLFLTLTFAVIPIFQ